MNSDTEGGGLKVRAEEGQNVHMCVGVYSTVTFVTDR